jgi:hypothetical protein
MFNAGGLAIMLKAMGVDPQQIIAQLTGAAQLAQNTMNNFDQRLKFLENAVQRNNQLLSEVLIELKKTEVTNASNGLSHISVAGNGRRLENSGEHRDISESTSGHVG